MGNYNAVCKHGRRRSGKGCARCSVARLLLRVQVRLWRCKTAAQILGLGQMQSEYQLAWHFVEHLAKNDGACQLCSEYPSGQASLLACYMPGLPGIRKLVQSAQQAGFVFPTLREGAAARLTPRRN